MRCFALTVLGLSLAATSAFAASDGKYSKATVDGITKSLSADGCKLGEIVSGAGFYTVSGADCADGKYDVTVDTNFKITEMKKK